MLNQAHLIGNLGQDPKVETSANGTTYAYLSVANNRVWSKDDERREETTWINVIAFGRLAQTLQGLGTGDQVAVSGRLKNRHKDGRITGLELVAERVDFLRIKGAEQAARRNAEQAEGEQVETIAY